MRLATNARRTKFAVILATGVLTGNALAGTQPPHDVAGGTACVRCHIPYGVVNDSAQATGAATTGSSATSLVDSSKTWTTGSWTGGVVTITSGTNLGLYRTITTNNATSLGWTDPLPTPLGVGDTYQIGKTSFTLSETDVCENCHSSSGVYDGVNDPNFGAKNNWQGGIYNADNATLKAGKDRWCASCHDEAPAYIGGVLAPWVAGEEGVDTDWGTTGYGFYKTGHGLPSSAVYPWTLKTGSTQQRNGAGLTCDACHDTTASHVDGVARSYTHSPNPAGYQSGYRLKSVAGMVPMQMPRVYQSADPSVKPEDFPLCLSCHDARPFTSVSAKATNYRDDVAGRNDHNFHLALQDKVFRSDWSFDASVPDSRPTCITCHNVHGSTQIAMINDGLLTSRGMNLTYSNAGAGTPPVGLSLADSNHTAWHMNQTQYSPSNPACLCAQNCHYNPDPNFWDFYTRSPFDNALPQILSAYGTSAGNLVSVRFSKPVFGPTGLALQPADLALADASGRTITAVDHVAGGIHPGSTIAPTAAGPSAYSSERRVGGPTRSTHPTAFSPRREATRREPWRRPRSTSTSTTQPHHSAVPCRASQSPRSSRSTRAPAPSPSRSAGAWAPRARPTGRLRKACRARTGGPPGPPRSMAWA